MRHRIIFNFSYGLKPFCSPAQINIWAPKAVVSQTFPFSAVLPCADKHVEFSQCKDLLLLSGTVTLKRERAAVGEVFRREGPPTYGCS